MSRRRGEERARMVTSLHEADGRESIPCHVQGVAQGERAFEQRKKGTRIHECYPRCMHRQAHISIFELTRSMSGGTIVAHYLAGAATARAAAAAVKRAERRSTAWSFMFRASAEGERRETEEGSAAEVRRDNAEGMEKALAEARRHTTKTERSIFRSFCGFLARGLRVCAGSTAKA